MPGKTSSALPFGESVPLAAVSGTTYATTQLLVQQIAYKLSDKIYSFSPETFDLDVAAKAWAAAENTNVHGYAPSVLPLQTRAGAGSLALGYIFSPDFDVSKRHIPQSLLAPTGSLQALRATLDQLSLLYSVSSPFVGHVAAADYSAAHGLVADYDAALRLAEDVGLSLVSSSSAREAQHMALFATLLASVAPALHIYDGVRAGRETVQVTNVLGEAAVGDVYSKLAAEVGKLNPRLDTAGKVLELFKLFNAEVGTEYAPFEYHGHETPDVVLVAFGSTETTVAKQVLTKIAGEGAKVGVINVRVYRPFIEEAFLAAIPASARTITVLGQVNEDGLTDEATQSALYGDVLTAVTFCGKFAEEPEVIDIKYSAANSITPQGLVNTLHKVFGNAGEAKALPALIDAEQYTFWDLDSSAALESPAVIGKLFSQNSKASVSVHEAYDNLTQGGIVRTDVRVAQAAVDAAYDIADADVVVVADDKILKSIDVLNGLSEGGGVILKLANFKEEDVEKKLPAAFRKGLQERGAALYILDPAVSPAFENDVGAARALLEVAFLKVTNPSLDAASLSKLGFVSSATPTLEQTVEAVGQTLLKVEIPESWAEAEVDAAAPSLITALKPNSFVSFDKSESETSLQLHGWQEAAKGLVFKEAYETQAALRPDLAVKTTTVTVKENRRLTPQDYDRNIFHIEFDLGTTGLTYKIGEALGIHAENDEQEVQAFIEYYGLDAAQLVQVPGRDSENLTEVRTVHQALIQNIDILGKPAKRFYEALAEFATDETEKKKLETLGSQAGAEEFKRRSEIDTVTYVDILQEFTSARPSFEDLVKIVAPMKRREYSIASAQAVTPNSVALMIVVVDWVDPKGRQRLGQATRYLSSLRPGAKVTVSVKPSVMKLPVKDTAPLIMAGLGTGLAPFRAFVQYRAMQKAQGKEIGSILLYLGSRHQREEYLYGEEWEAYLAAGVVTLVGSAFSRDQPQKIYIQDRMRQTIDDIVQAYIKDEGSFYLCGPTWPVPDVTAVLQEAIAAEAKASGKKVDPKKEIEKLKEEGRYVLEVY